MINFMKNICMAGGFIQVVAFGAGLWSLDALWSRTRGAAHAVA
jgi:putative oxidoreductase